MTAPTQLSEDDAKKDYLALCLKMSHAQLYSELMRVHKEATLLIQQAVEQEREACAQLAANRVANTNSDRDFEVHQFTCQVIADDIRARGQ